MRWGCSYIASRSLRKGLEIKHANGQPKISSVIRGRWPGRFLLVTTRSASMPKSFLPINFPANQLHHREVGEVVGWHNNGTSPFNLFSLFFICLRNMDCQRSARGKKKSYSGVFVCGSGTAQTQLSVTHQCEDSRAVTFLTPCGVCGFACSPSQAVNWRQNSLSPLRRCVLSKNLSGLYVSLCVYVTHNF